MDLKEKLQKTIDPRIAALDESLSELTEQHGKGLEFDPNEVLNCLLELRDLVKITRDIFVQKTKDI